MALCLLHAPAGERLARRRQTARRHPVAPTPRPQSPERRRRSAPIVNLTRSGRRTDLTRILLDADAPAGVRDAVAAALTAHVSGPARGDFVGEPRVRFTSIDADGKVKLVATWTYTYGGEGAGAGRCRGRGLFSCGAQRWSQESGL
jgi:hypothetical protein